jgi:hypothetical protein
LILKEKFQMSTAPAAEVILAPRQGTQEVSAADFMPIFTVEQAVTKKEMMNTFIGKVLKESVDGEGDYGAIPGAGKKKILLKPGAEKLCSIFGLAPQYSEDKIIEDWTGAQHGGEPLFYYSYRCALMRGGRFMGEAIGSCNSWESKYRYRWSRADQLPAGTDLEKLPVRGGKQTLFAFDFQIDKAETTGQYGKPSEYWQAFKDAVEGGKARRVNRPTKGGAKPGWEYDIDATLYRVPNPEIADVVNTCQKMAQKRALVAAVLVVTNCSDAFTQDMEDFEEPATAQPAATAQQQNGTANLSPITKRTIPTELTPIVAKLLKEPTKTNVNAGLRLMEDRLCDKFGTVAGVETYKRITEAFHATTPDVKIGDIVELLMDLFEASNKPATDSAKVE